MADSSRQLRFLCVNCNICVNNFRRFRVLEELNVRVIALLCSWAHPLIITEDDYVCEACYNIAMSSVNQALQQDTEEQAGSSQLSLEHQASTTSRGHAHVCILCGCSTARRQRDRILRDNPTELQLAMTQIISARVAPRQITDSDHVCHACWLRIQREARRNIIIDDTRSSRPSTSAQPIKQQVPVQPILSTEQPEDVPVQFIVPMEQIEDVPAQSNIILPNYRRAANSNDRCVFANCHNTPLRSISDKLRATVVSHYNFYLPKLARVCDYHIMVNSWDALYGSQNSIQYFNAEEIQHMLSFINMRRPYLDFEEIEDMEDRDFKSWVGLSKEKFQLIINEVPRLANFKKRTLGLSALLIKMRTGESNERLSILLNTPRRTMEGLMNKVREMLYAHFVPANLGFQSITRQDIIARQLTIPNGLYNNNNNCIVVCDGTYVYTNKSANYSFQKQTYSLHKNRNLFKPFMIVACDGYIIDCVGPEKATKSDAAVMNDLFVEGSSHRAYFRLDDVFILDRGFRDSIGFLEGCGYKAYMPESLLEGEHQLTTEQANRSRCVTICRWVVEAVNGHFKRDFKILRHECSHRSLPSMMVYFKIAAAILNRFGVRFRDNMYVHQILERIRQTINTDNQLSKVVQLINLNRRSASFSSITANVDNVQNFPSLEFRDLILFSLGTYQIKQARSYYGEHVRSQGEFTIELCTESINPAQYGLRGSDTTLIRGRIKSRHRSNKTYFVYILIENNIPGYTGIIEYCCNCLVGRRTIGCCAHVMSLVWYLGWARHQISISAPAEYLDDFLVDGDQD